MKPLSSNATIFNVSIVNHIYLKLQKMVCQLPYRQICVSFILSCYGSRKDGQTLRTIFTDKGVYTAWKVAKYGVYPGPYFPAFGLNTEKYFVSFRIQSECGKIRTRKNSVFGQLSRSVIFSSLSKISFEVQDSALSGVRSGGLASILGVQSPIFC